MCQSLNNKTPTTNIVQDQLVKKYNNGRLKLRKMKFSNRNQMDGCLIAKQVGWNAAGIQLEKIPSTPAKSIKSKQSLPSSSKTCPSIKGDRVSTVGAAQCKGRLKIGRINSVDSRNSNSFKKPVSSKNFSDSIKAVTTGGFSASVKPTVPKKSIDSRKQGITKKRKLGATRNRRAQRSHP